MRGESKHAMVVGYEVYNSKSIVATIDEFNIGTNYTRDKELLYITIEDLIKAIVNGVPSQYDMLTSITVLGNGLKRESDVSGSIEEIIALQDIIVHHQLKKVKLNFITSNTDLYDRIRHDYTGRDVLFYRNAEVFLTPNLIMSELMNIMEGNMDGMGIRMEVKDTLTKIERIEQEQKRLEEDAKQVTRDTLDYEKNVPESRLDRADFVGSAENRSRIEKIEKEREEAVRFAERYNLDYFVDNWGDVDVYNDNGDVIEDLKEYERELKEKRRNRKKEVKRDTRSVKDIEDIDRHKINSETEGMVYTGESKEKSKPKERLGGSIEQAYPRGNSSPIRKDSPVKKYREVDENIKVTGRETGGDIREVRLSRLKMMYNDLLSDGMGIIEDKLSEDSVVMAISSLKGSGGSGVTAQVAEIYAMLGRKVVVIDLDLNGRGQTYYFNNYDKRVAENRGIANSLTNVVEGGLINKASVKINSRIDVCGISTRLSNIGVEYKNTIERNLNSIIQDAKEFYDIVLIDVPIEDFDQYMNNRLLDIERYLFVVENKEYEIDLLFREYIEEFIKNNELLVEDILNNSTIVLNKYNPLNRDSEGYLVNSKWLKEKLYDKGSPYDVMLVGGEVPYAEGFEEQFITGKRYVWQDSGYMASLKHLLKGAV